MAEERVKEGEEEGEKKKRNKKEKRDTIIPLNSSKEAHYKECRYDQVNNFI